MMWVAVGAAEELATGLVGLGEVAVNSLLDALFVARTCADVKLDATAVVGTTAGTETASVVARAGVTPSATAATLGPGSSDTDGLDGATEPLPKNTSHTINPSAIAPATSHGAFVLRGWVDEPVGMVRLALKARALASEERLTRSCEFAVCAAPILSRWVIDA